MNNRTAFDEIFEPATVNTDMPQEDTLATRLYSIKPPGKGDSGMAEEK
jgi:hypothetical protein